MQQEDPGKYGALMSLRLISPSYFPLQADPGLVDSYFFLEKLEVASVNICNTIKDLLGQACVQ